MINIFCSSASCYVCLFVGHLALLQIARINDIRRLFNWLVIYIVTRFVGHSVSLHVHFYFFIFLAFDFCRFCVVVRVFHPRHNGQWPPTSKDFLSQILSITFFSYLNFWERASIIPFECSVLNKGTTGTIFITSLVWRGPWLGIDPGTSRTRSQHSTTRLSRRR